MLGLCSSARPQPAPAPAAAATPRSDWWSRSAPARRSSRSAAGGRSAPDGGHGRGLVDRGEPGLAAHAGLARKGCTKRYDKVLGRLGRLKERYRQVAGQYDIAGARRPGRHVRAAQTPGPGGPALELGDDPPPARRLGPPHHLATRGQRPLDPVPLGLPPGRQSRRTGPGYRPGAGPASHAHQPRGRCHAATVFHAIIRALDKFCDAITPGLHPQVISFQSLVLSRIQI